MTATKPDVGPIIVLEGLDKTGKSTLALELAERAMEMTNAPCRVIAFGVPEPGKDPFLEYLETAYESGWHRFGTIVDRMHWSEAAYGTVFRPGEWETQRRRAEMARMVDAALGLVGATVVHCTRALDEAALALDETDRSDHGGVEFDLDQVRRLDSVFRAQATAATYRANGLTVVEHEFATPFPDDVLERAIRARADFADREGPLQ